MATANEPTARGRPLSSGRKRKRRRSKRRRDALLTTRTKEPGTASEPTAEIKLKTYKNKDIAQKDITTTHKKRVNINTAANVHKNKNQLLQQASDHHLHHTAINVAIKILVEVLC